MLSCRRHQSWEPRPEDFLPDPLPPGTLALPLLPLEPSPPLPLPVLPGSRLRVEKPSLGLMPPPMPDLPMPWNAAPRDALKSWR